MCFLICTCPPFTEFTSASSILCFRTCSRRLHMRSEAGIYKYIYIYIFCSRHLLSVTWCDLSAYSKTNTTGHSDFIDSLSRCDVLSVVENKTQTNKAWVMCVLCVNKIPENICTCGCLFVYL